MPLHRRRVASLAMTLTMLGLALGCAPVALPTFDDGKNSGVGGFNGGTGGTGNQSTDPTPAPTPTPTPTPTPAPLKYGTLTWTLSTETLPAGANFTAGTVVNGNFVVVGGINTGGLLSSVSAFPVAAANLGTRQALTAYRSNLFNDGICSHGAYAFGDNLVVAGGQTLGAGYTANTVSVLANALGGGIWTDADPFTAADPIDGGRQDFGSAQTGQYVYVVGGRKGGTGTTQGNPTTDILVGTYQDGAITSWSLAGNLPVATAWPAAVVLNNRLYVFGGQAGNDNVNTLSSYPINGDGTLGTRQGETVDLETTGTIPGASGASLFAFGNNLYIAGGMGSTGPRVESYISVIGADSKLSKWKAAGPMPDRVALAASGTDSAGHFYMAGGSIEKEGSPQGGEPNDRVYVGTATIPQ